MVFQVFENFLKILKRVIRYLSEDQMSRTRENTIQNGTPRVAIISRNKTMVPDALFFLRTNHNLDFRAQSRNVINQNLN